MRILGISALYHDSAAAIVVDGRIVAAAPEEERFTRMKHDARFPGAPSPSHRLFVSPRQLRLSEFDSVGARKTTRVAMTSPSCCPVWSEESQRNLLSTKIQETFFVVVKVCSYRQGFSLP